MKQDTIYVGIDDSKRKLVIGTLGPDDAQPLVRTIANEPRAIRRFIQRLKRQGLLRACYEAGPSGYDLHHQLTALGVACQVVAPSLTPRRPGERIKTDRRDALKLVHLFRAGELSPIRVPDEAEEAVRDFVRCRGNTQKEALRWRQRLVKFLDRHGRVYREGSHWTQAHWRWLHAQDFTQPTLQFTLDTYRFTLEQALLRQAEMEREIGALAQSEPYKEPVGWLRCFRGIDTLSAMILMAEIQDFKRFPTAPDLMGYLGLVPSEHSTGERVRRGPLTKTGNGHARRILIEAAWHYQHRARLSKSLAARTKGQPPEVVAHAWKTQVRLHRRYYRLLARGKRPSVAVAAVSRELTGFIWAAMTQTACARKAA
jgi:transposase